MFVNVVFSLLSPTYVDSVRLFRSGFLPINRKYVIVCSPYAFNNEIWLLDFHFCLKALVDYKIDAFFQACCRGPAFVKKVFRPLEISKEDISNFSSLFNRLQASLLSP